MDNEAAIAMLRNMIANIKAGNIQVLNVDAEDQGDIAMIEMTLQGSPDPAL